ncbi:hypothetical protein SAMN02983003_2792 [Devosia enhydra]|uniref:Opacity protein n=1 Tax=Devosia enhydra TaxID=665118 RepID=A0A1K2HZS3_9HYPH|nr:hypothetical protein [Devosia enhydra]SFZ85626.1 hypothetical protein SAMN02983003_2792 [Devosia enhydra]
MKITLAIASALLLGTASAYAADIILPPAPAPAPASNFWGVGEIGVIGYSGAQSEDDEYAMLGGGYGAFALWADMGGLVVGLDGYGEILGLNDDTEDYFPGGVGVIGGHIGTGLGGGYVGVFGAYGATPDSGNDEWQGGWAVGVEGLADFSTVSLFGKLGYADVRTDEEDSGFTGTFGEIGAMFALTPEFALQTSFGAGYAPENFADESEDDDGYYLTAGIKGAYQLPTDFALALTASYDIGAYGGIEESDWSINHTVKVGLAIPFGGRYGDARDALNPLATPTAPFRAGSWGDFLD